MQCSDGRFLGEADGDANRVTGAVRHAMVVAGVLGPMAWLLIGCAAGEDLVTTAAPPAEQTLGTLHGRGTPAPSESDLQATTLNVTPSQRGFLDALSAAGVHPSSELEALSIGSHVCQAHAAGQSDQAVWDYIAPMVRSDVADMQSSTKTTADPQVNEATADYIRIATQRLCY
ncbi:DUF732 domain-containing protein [Mycolicibacterium sp. CH28]|uniref:DUF732 domain-containing protein n=1 Tax=Mycolicibacterium sp. CH28 TaxID=2512237 RepID=UPI001F3E8878|nr:DUF732 domain-containing protein [Mycolicibacterium sp. CH28]